MSGPLKDFDPAARDRLLGQTACQEGIIRSRAPQTSNVGTVAARCRRGLAFTV